MTSMLLDQATLVGWQHEYLQRLEAWLGPRNPRFALGPILQCSLSTYRGPDGKPTPHPHIFRLFADHDIIAVRLTDNSYFAPDNGALARWQLAHECVHLLDVVPGIDDTSTTTVLEEGIATVFQHMMVIGFRAHETPESPYTRAEALVRPLVEAGVLPPIVRGLRQRGIAISKISPQHLTEYPGSTIDATTAGELARRFLDNA